VVTETFPSQAVRITISELGDQVDTRARIHAGEGKMYASIQNQFTAFLATSKIPLTAMVLTTMWFYTQVRQLAQALCHQVLNIVGVQSLLMREQEETDLELGLNNKTQEKFLKDFHSLTAEEAQDLMLAQTGPLFQVKKKLLAYKLEGLLKDLNPASITQEISQQAVRAERSMQIRNFVWSLHQAHNVIQSHAPSVKNFCTKWPLTQHNTDFVAVAQLMSVIPSLQEERLAIWSALTGHIETLNQLHSAGNVEEIKRVAAQIQPQLERSNQLSRAIHTQIASIMAILPVGLTLSKMQYLAYTQEIAHILLQPIVSPDPEPHQKWLYGQINGQIAKFFAQRGLESRYAELFTAMVKGWVQEVTLRQKMAYIFDQTNKESLHGYAIRYFDHYINKTQTDEIVLRAGYTQHEIRAMKDEIYARHPIVPSTVFTEPPVVE
jgi:hypothetical protein